MASKRSVICDTNILAYFFEGKKKAADIIESNYIIISSVTFIEILSNKSIPASKRELVEEFLASFQIIETNPLINKLAVQFRLLYNLDTIDAVIAATAKYCDIKLITADKAFYKVKNINIIPFSK